MTETRQKQWFWVGVWCCAFVLLSSTSATLATESTFGPARLEPSIILRHAGDYRRIAERVERAIEAGSRSVNFVVTVNCRLDDQHRVTGYGLSDRRDGEWTFRPMDDEVRAEILDACRTGIQLAADAGLDLAFLCHLDAYAFPYVWRNEFDFDPSAEIEGFRYDRGLLQPLLALAMELAPRQTIDFAVAGEMGTSVFTYPHRYQAAIERLRKQAQRQQAAARVRFGISLNHSGVQGKAAASEHPAELRQLFEGLDFIGFSNYHAVGVPPRPEHFANSVRDFAEEMAKHQVPLQPDTVIHFSEIAVGGYGPDGFTEDPQQAATTLWEGTHNPRRGPWRAEAMRQFRAQYHEALLTFLATQTAPWQVEIAYLWSEGSWDPQGISARTFVDDSICEAIRSHNDAASRPGAKEPAP